MKTRWIVSQIGCAAFFGSFLLSIVGSTSAHAADLSAVIGSRPLRILVTSFDPFGSSSENNSQPVAQSVARFSKRFPVPVEIKLCNLPVVFDEAAVQAHLCIQSYQPDLVVSLGEAGCSLRIETAADNRDHAQGLRDNAGNAPVNHVITPGSPERVGFHFPVQAMFCGLTRYEADALDVSRSPGYYVCNNTAYHLANELNPATTLFTFIHVPNSTCSIDKRNAYNNADQIVRMISSGILAAWGKQSDATLQSDPELWPTVSNGIRMPTSLAEVDALIQKQSAQTGSCVGKFLNRLRSRYSPEF